MSLGSAVVRHHPWGKFYIHKMLAFKMPMKNQLCIKSQARGLCSPYQVLTQSHRTRISWKQITQQYHETDFNTSFRAHQWCIQVTQKKWINSTNFFLFLRKFVWIDYLFKARRQNFQSLYIICYIPAPFFPPLPYHIRVSVCSMTFLSQDLIYFGAALGAYLRPGNQLSGQIQPAFL